MSSRVAPWIFFAGCVGFDPGTETTTTTTSPDPYACADHVLDSGPSRVEGSTAGQGDDFTASCADPVQPDEDEAWAFTAPADGTWAFTTINGMGGPVLSVLDGCGGAELVCSDPPFDRAGLTVDLVAGQTVIVVAEGGWSPYVLDVFQVQPTEVDCDDQLDNDDNYRIDCQDSACAADPACVPTCPDLFGEVGVPLRASTVGEPDDWRAKCNYYGSDGYADVSVAFTAQQAGSYGLQVQGIGWWTYQLDGCDGVELRDCNVPYMDNGVRLELVGGQQVIVRAERAYRESDGPFDVNFYAIEGWESSCSDGLDNDFVDGADCRDPACEFDPACAEDCTDSDGDDDHDGEYGCRDSWCEGDPACDEDCTNGLDDNGQDGIDCADPACDGSPGCVENCGNDVDDDGDYAIDCMDGSCAGSCVAVCPDHVLGAPGVVALDPVGSTDEIHPSCALYDTAWADASVAFTAPASGRYRFDGTLSGSNKPVVVTDGCGGPELACSTNDGVGVDLVAGQTVIAHVEATTTWIRAYAIEVSAVPSVETACDDGVDEDADGDADCGDPDCASDPICAEDCTNGTDDDYDQLVDCTDPGCAGAPNCAVVCPDDTISGPLPLQVSGSLKGMTADRTATCSNGAPGPDVTWEFVAPATGTYTFDTEGTVYTDTILSVVDGCAGAVLACNDDESPSGELWSLVEVDLVAGQVVTVVVDSWWPQEDGDYLLNVR